MQTQVFGKLLMTLGATCALYFALVFDPSVVVPGNEFIETQRVSNIGRLSDRQNGVLIGVGAFIAGAILMVFGARGNTRTDNAPPMKPIPPPTSIQHEAGPWTCRCGQINPESVEVCTACKRSPAAII